MQEFQFDTEYKMRSQVWEIASFKNQQKVE